MSRSDETDIDDYLPVEGAMGTTDYKSVPGNSFPGFQDIRTPIIEGSRMNSEPFEDVSSLGLCPWYEQSYNENIFAHVKTPTKYTNSLYIPITSSSHLNTGARYESNTIRNVDQLPRQADIQVASRPSGRFEKTSYNDRVDGDPTAEFRNRLVPEVGYQFVVGQGRTGTHITRREEEKNSSFKRKHNQEYREIISEREQMIKQRDDALKQQFDDVLSFCGDETEALKPVVVGNKKKADERSDLSGSSQRMIKMSDEITELKNLIKTLVHDSKTNETELKSLNKEEQEISENKIKIEDEIRTGIEEQNKKMEGLSKIKDNSCSTVVVENVDKKQPSSLRIKLEKYNGSTSVESFLKKFETCSRRNHWDDDEKTDQLSCALVEPASQVLWDLGEDGFTDWKELVTQLKLRYGSADQTSMYRTQLRCRRKGKQETLNELAQDIRRLLALAYPGPTSTLKESVACDYFLDALNDSDLAMKIREREPVSLENAFKLALKYEAYGKSIVDPVLNKPVKFKSIKEHDSELLINESESSIMLKEFINKQQEQMQNLTRDFMKLQREQMQLVTKEMKELNKNILSNSTESSKEMMSVSSDSSDKRALYAGEGKTNDHETDQREGIGRRYKENGACYLCGSKDHYRNNCPRKWKNNSRNSKGVMNYERTKTDEEQSLNKLYHVISSPSAFLKIRLNGKVCWGLLDTGSEASLIPTNLVPDHLLQPSVRQLQAANGSSMGIIGEAMMTMRIGTENYEIHCLVTDHVSEVIIGMNWLRIHDIQWNFRKDEITINGVTMKLQTPPMGTGVTRRIAVQQDTVIPSRSEMDIPMYTIYPSLDRISKQWMTIPTVLKKDVLIGRILVKDQADDVTVRIINASEHPVTLIKGTSCPLEEVIFDEGLENENANEEVVNKDSLDTLIKNVDESVSEEHREELKQLIEQYRQAFSLGEWDLGYTELIQHKIDTGNELPVRQRLRRQPITKLAEIDEKVQEMLQNGIIEPSCSEWSSNVVIVKKKDGSLRFCIDYRAVNLKTRKDVFPLPLISESLDLLSGARWYSTFDLRAGYHQMALDPKDAHKTTFLTRRGSYQFRVLPFGLCNAPSGFSRLMSLVMSGLCYEICLIYLDDIIVFSSSLREHMIRLEIIFIRLIKANLKLKPSKCFLLQKKVLFLGHIVSEDGVATDPTKVEAVKNWPTPRTVKDVRAFIGLCSYYRKFIHNFAEVARPLHALTRKNMRFHWTSECEDAFQQLKFLLTNTPILGLPRDDGQFILDTDASGDSIGAVLSQEQDGQERVLCYASRLCSKAERNYSVTRREMLAVVHFLKYFRQYLLGHHFLIRSDHAALQWLRRTPEPIGQQARWIEQLEEYDFVLKHRPGVRHGNADAMSRYPRESAGVVIDRITETKPKATKIINDVNIDRWTVDELRIRQLNDADISQIIKWKERSKTPPRKDELMPYSAVVKSYVSQWKLIVLYHGVLYRNWYDSNGQVDSRLLIVPPELRNDIMMLSHSGMTGGHYGVRRTLKQVQRRAYWLGWRDDVHRFVLRCDNCARYRREKPPRQGELCDMRVGEPMERFGINITGPRPQSRTGREVYSPIEQICEQGTSSGVNNRSMNNKETPLQDEAPVTVSDEMNIVHAVAELKNVNDGRERSNLNKIVDDAELILEASTSAQIGHDDSSTVAGKQLLSSSALTIPCGQKVDSLVIRLNRCEDRIGSPPANSRVSRMTFIPPRIQATSLPEMRAFQAQIPEHSSKVDHKLLFDSRWVERMSCVASLMASEIMSLDGTMTEGEFLSKMRNLLKHHETRDVELKGLLAGLTYVNQQPLLAHWYWSKITHESSCLYANIRESKVNWGFKEETQQPASERVQDASESSVELQPPAKRNKRKSTSGENLKLLVALVSSEMLRMGLDITLEGLYLRVSNQVKSLHYGTDLLHAVMFGMLNLPEFPYLFGVLFQEFPPRRSVYQWEFIDV